MARGLRLYGDGISFLVVFGQSVSVRVLLIDAHIAQSRWMPPRRIWEVVGHVASPFDLS